MQLLNSKWRPFLKIKIFMSGKIRKSLEKSWNFFHEKSTNPVKVLNSLLGEEKHVRSEQELLNRLEKEQALSIIKIMTYRS